ncbi:MAG: protoporphyrinogen oxidase [Candidatus Zixiibacteriota bacterium]
MRRVAIIGGGISGLAALHFIRTRQPEDVEVELFEKDSRTGGTIGTERTEGFVADWGPNGFLDKTPLTLRLVSELGLDKRLERAAPKAERRFIYRNRRLNEIHAHPLKFMRSSILSVPGRLRLALEPFIAPKKDDGDETIFAFARRRIGREAAVNMIGPMVSGIFGGDARQLSLRACFPVMVEMEKEYGSLFKALIARKKAGKKASAAGPSGRLTSFQNGLYTLVEVMHERYKNYIKINHEVISVIRHDDGYRLSFAKGEPQTFDAVICAAPAWAAAGMFQHMDNGLAELLDSIPYASIAVVCTGFRREDVGHDLAGFGFLIPRGEDKRVLGSIWTSSIFSNCSPEGMVQFRTMVGGATDPEAVKLTDEALKTLVADELSPVVGITGPPVWVKIFKFAKGIPQFVVGHPDKMTRLEQFQRCYPGLYFTGNAYDGVGLNDCVVRSDKVVRALFTDQPVAVK